MAHDLEQSRIQKESEKVRFNEHSSNKAFRSSLTFRAFAVPTMFVHSEQLIVYIGSHARRK